MDAEIGTYSNDNSASSISFDDIKKIYDDLLELDPYYKLIKEKIPDKLPNDYIVLINLIHPSTELKAKLIPSPFVKIIENTFMPNCAVYIIKKNIIGL